MTGAPLPNPRNISLLLNYPLDGQNQFNSLTTFFSQFVIHDISLISATSGPDGLPKACVCGTTDPDCINIPSIDNSTDGTQQCEVTPRSLGVHATMACYVSPREQVNTLTAWLDLSQTYDISSANYAALRVGKFGIMNSSFLQTGNGANSSENLPIAGAGDSQTCVNTIVLHENWRLLILK